MYYEEGEDNLFQTGQADGLFIDTLSSRLNRCNWNIYIGVENPVLVTGNEFAQEFVFFWCVFLSNLAEAFLVRSGRWTGCSLTPSVAGSIVAADCFQIFEVLLSKSCHYFCKGVSLTLEKPVIGKNPHPPLPPSLPPLPAPVLGKIVAILSTF